jgi:hypothetical protein
MKFYPKIFTASSVFKEDWTKQEPQYFTIKNTSSILESLYTGLFVLMIAAAGFWRLKNLKK